MDTVFKAAAFAIAGAVMAVTLRRSSPDGALLLAVAVCVGLLTVVITITGPVIGFADELRELTRLSSSVTKPLFKIVGIGIVTQTASSVCGDAKEDSVAKAVELCGSVMALYAALPLMSAVLSIVKELL